MTAEKRYDPFPVNFEFFLQSILRNAFIPIPEADRIFTGGDEKNFRQVGVDALRSLVQDAGVSPDSRVLEIGSGLGRVALPLTQLLTSGTYVGIEIVMDGVAWCHENISRRYKNFKFMHFDLFNEFYNPTGRGSISEIKLPFEDAIFDVILLNSVFTHLNLDDTTAYLNEIARLLVPGGRLWASWFLVDSEIGSAVLDGRSLVPLKWTDGSGVYYSNDQKGTLAVAYEEQLVNRLLDQSRLPASLVLKGEWLMNRPRIDGGFQDLMVCVK